MKRAERDVPRLLESERSCGKDCGGMSDARDAGIPPQEVERRLEELRALYKLGMALRDVRFIEPVPEVPAVPEPDPSRERDGPQTET